VYKISYKDSNAIYVGQIKRKLNTGISEHRNQINRKSVTESVTEHRLRHNYNFDSLNLKILDSEKFFSLSLSGRELFLKYSIYNYKITNLITKPTRNTYNIYIYIYINSKQIINI